MEMDEGVDFEQVIQMTAGELKQFLTEEVLHLNMTSADGVELEERNVDGKAFIQLSREDFGLIYPSKEKFLLASKLYKYAQRIRMSDLDSRNTGSLLDDMSDLEGVLPSSGVSTPGSSHSISTPGKMCMPGSSRDTSTPGSSRSSTPFLESNRKRQLSVQSSSAKKQCRDQDASRSDFKLPRFSPDLKLCISKDAFYTSTQRNKLIKEGCTALRGFCWEEERSITKEDKKNLARMLYELAPNSLGDAENETKPEAGIYGQVVRWFQNHSYTDQKACKKASKKKSHSCEEERSSDDEDAVQAHLLELDKEMKRKQPDREKITRLLSLTFSSRRADMLSLPANQRISTALKKYPCLTSPVHVMQEMFHVRGHRFTTFNSVREKIAFLGTYWKKHICPALVRLAEESGDAEPESDELNDVTIYCLRLILEKLRLKKGKSPADPLDAIICCAPTIDEVLKTNSLNSHAYVACIGSTSVFSSGVVVCNKKVITDEIGSLVASTLLVLLAVHYTYELSFNPECKSAMEFLQEKLLGDKLARKMSTNYTNLFRAVNCIEQKMKQQIDDIEEDTADSGATQEYNDFS